MANCSSTNYTGREVVLSVAPGCGDALPLESEWIPAGALRNKGYEASSDTIDFTTDDSQGGYREEIGSFKTFTISLDGIVKFSDADTMRGFHLLERTFMDNERGADRVIWARLDFPDQTITGFMMISSIGRESPYDDAITFSGELTKAPSAFGVIAEPKTPGSATAPQSITVTPATLSLAVAAQENVSATVAPSGASQGVFWYSSNVAVATVSQTGTVTGVSAGDASIIAKSVAGDVFQSVPVTVTA